LTIIKAKNYDDLSKKAAVVIAAQILKKPNAVLGLATGSSPIGTYQELVKMNKSEIVDFSDVKTVNLDEYIGLPPTDENSYQYFMDDNLFNHININKDSTYVPQGISDNPDEVCENYEQLIKDLGGIDLQLLGIGLNGHIAFNEPSESFSPKTFVTDLTESTIDANARFYSSRDEVPKKAITMGIGTIMKAKSILLISSGASKTEILQKALFGPVTPEIPASILQYHNDLTVIFCE
jgi:glucosamine-6-phosphate deaminase